MHDADIRIEPATGPDRDPMTLLRPALDEPTHEVLGPELLSGQGYDLYVHRDDDSIMPDKWINDFSSCRPDLRPCIQMA